MRIEDKPSKRQATFKASRKGKNKVCEPSESSSSEMDEEEAHFMRKLKKGSRKHQGKLTSKCLNCGRVGHFASKCLQDKNGSSKDEEDHYIKKGRKHHQEKKNKKGQYEKKKKDSRKYKNSLYSRKGNNFICDVPFLICPRIGPNKYILLILRSWIWILQS